MFMVKTISIIVFNIEKPILVCKKSIATLLVFIEFELFLKDISVNNYQLLFGASFQFKYN